MRCYRSRTRCNTENSVNGSILWTRTKLVCLFVCLFGTTFHDGRFFFSGAEPHSETAESSVTGYSLFWNWKEETEKLACGSGSLRPSSVPGDVPLGKPGVQWHQSRSDQCGFSQWPDTVPNPSLKTRGRRDALLLLTHYFTVIRFPSAASISMTDSAYHE